MAVPDAATRIAGDQLDARRLAENGIQGVEHALIRNPMLHLRIPDSSERRPGSMHASEPWPSTQPRLVAEGVLVRQALLDEPADRILGRHEVLGRDAVVVRFGVDEVEARLEVRVVGMPENMDGGGGCGVCGAHLLW